MTDSHTAVDLFGRLPLELSQHISRYLQLYQIFQARRVSKRWNAILSSSYIVESMFLRPWYTEEKSSLRVPEGLSESAVVSLKAEHVDAFRNGRAFSVANFNIDSAFLNIITYANGILAWLTTDGKSIRLACLASGKLVTFASPNGAAIEYMELRGHFLVATTELNNIFYIWKLLDGIQSIKMLEPLSFGSDPFILDVAMSDSRLAICYEERTGKSYLTTVDTATRIMYDFELKLKRSPLDSPEDFRVQHTLGGKSVVYFERVLGSPSYVYFTRVTIDGNVESQGQLKLPSFEGYSSYNEEALAPLQLSGCVTLWSYLRHLPWAVNDGPDVWLLLRICYVHDHLEVKEQTIERIGKIPPKVSTELFWWKEVVYMGIDLNEQGRIQVMDLWESTWKPTAMSLSRLPDNRRGSPSLTTERPWFLLGDETFLISIRGGSCVIWCFDRHLTQTIPCEDDGLWC